MSVCKSAEVFVLGTSGPKAKADQPPRLLNWALQVLRTSPSPGKWLKPHVAPQLSRVQALHLQRGRQRVTWPGCDWASVSPGDEAVKGEPMPSPCMCSTHLCSYFTAKGTMTGPKHAASTRPTARRLAAALLAAAVAAALLTQPGVAAPATFYAAGDYNISFFVASPVVTEDQVTP